MRTLTKDQISLLLFLETCAVDHAGMIDIRHMNADDMKQAGVWDLEGFIDFGRMTYDSISNLVTGKLTHAVHLGDEAWGLANLHRRAKSDRTWATRSFILTKEKRGDSIKTA